MQHSSKKHTVGSDAFAEVELIRNVKDGDGDSFVYLLSEYRDRILSIAYSFGLRESEREDLIQEGYIALYKAACAYNSSSSSFSTFASVCIKNRMINWIEKNIKPVSSSLSLSSLDDSELSKSGIVQEDFEDSVIQREEIERLFSLAEQKLSKLEKSVFSLYIKGYSNDEICVSLSITKKACDNALFRIRTKLKAIRG